MSADDQVFLDVLSSIPNHIRHYSNDVAEYVDQSVEDVAGILREQLSSVRWLPDSVRPRPPPPPPSSLPANVASAYYEQLRDFLSRHRILTGLVVLATGTVLYRTYRSSRFCRKIRRAKRAKNGGRTEVVVVAGKPSLPLTRSLALDLERRGHIVYVVCNSAEDETLVHSYSRPDIKPLSIDITDPPSAGSSIERFAQFLQVPHAPASRVKANYLTLKAVILVPSISYETSPIATIPPSNFANLFNTHLLHPILTIQAFLPLLTTRLTPPPSTSTSAVTEPTLPPKVVVFTPSIISSINPPFHAPEATVCSALSAFTEVLAAELSPLSVPVTQLQLGTFDLAGFTPAASAGAAAAGRAAGLITAPGQEYETWPQGARAAYARNFGAHGRSVVGSGKAVPGLRGTPLRELHNTVFDVIDGSITASVVRVGLGADLYGFVGRWVPRGLVAWMMGVRRVDNLATWQPSPSAENSSHSGSEGDFTAVSGDEGFTSDADAWRSGLA